MALLEGEWSIDGLDMGWPRTPYTVSSFEVGDADVDTGDKRNAREDGDRFGRDYSGGRTLSFQLAVNGDGYGVLSRLAALESAWRSERVRLEPGAVSVLSYCRGGETRRVYGRGRRFTPDTTLDWAGVVPVTCDFRTVDHRFYDGAESAAIVGFVPDLVGGFTPPLIGPLVMSGQGVASQGITVGGTEAAWMVYRIDGPITNPVVTVTDQWSATLNVSLAADQWLLVDPQPWSRTVRRNDGANLAGVFSADSRRLSGMRVPPGTHSIFMRGNDPTATSSLSVFLRPAYASY